MKFVKRFGYLVAGLVAFGVIVSVTEEGGEESLKVAGCKNQEAYDFMERSLLTGYSVAVTVNPTTTQTIVDRGDYFICSVKAFDESKMSVTMNYHIDAANGQVELKSAAPLF